MDVRHSIPLLTLALSLGCGFNEECIEAQGGADDICVPPTAAANQAITLTAREGCGGCGFSATGCTITQSGDVLNVSLTTRSCTLPSGTACALACFVSDVQCQTPPLPEGRYRIAGFKMSRTSTVPVFLEVTNTATLTDCAL